MASVLAQGARPQRPDEADFRQRRYRAVFRVDAAVSDVAAASRQQLRSWLGDPRKNIDLGALDAGRPVIGNQTVLLYEAQTSADGSVTHRWRLREHATGWHTTLVVRAVQPASTWVWLEVEHVPGPGAPKQVAHVPRLARLLLEALDGHDGPAALRPGPQLVRTEDAVDELIDVLCDPDRRLPAIVASPCPAEPFESWRRLVEAATRYTVGLASAFLLAPDVVGQFNRRFGGATHRVAGGAIRTFLPVADPADPADAARHRVLSSRRLQSDPGRTAVLLAVLPREIAVNAPLPPALAHLPVAFRPSDEATTKSNLDLHDARAVEELLEEAGRSVAEARAEAADLSEQVLDLAAELDTAQAELADKSAQVTWTSTCPARRGHGWRGRVSWRWTPSPPPARLAASRAASPPGVSGHPRASPASPRGSSRRRNARRYETRRGCGSPGCCRSRSRRIPAGACS